MIRGIYSDELEQHVVQQLAHQGVRADDGGSVQTIRKFDAERYKAMEPAQLEAEYAARRTEAQSVRWPRSLRKGEHKSDRLDQAILLAKDDCESWAHEHIDRRDICTNPHPMKKWPYELLNGQRKVAHYGNCNHMFTLLLDEEQVRQFLVEPSQWLDDQSPPRYLKNQHRPMTPRDENPDPADPAEIDDLQIYLPGQLTPHEKAQAYLVAHFLRVARLPTLNVWQCAPNPVWSMLRSRLDLPFHSALTSESVTNTLSYLFEHMKCGVYVKIRNNALVMFVPFCNLEYRNTW